MDLAKGKRDKTDKTDKASNAKKAEKSDRPKLLRQVEKAAKRAREAAARLEEATAELEAVLAAARKKGMTPEREQDDELALAGSTPLEAVPFGSLHRPREEA